MHKAMPSALPMSAKLDTLFAQLRQLSEQIETALGSNEWEAAIQINSDRQDVLAKVFAEPVQQLDEKKIHYLQLLRKQTRRHQSQLQEQQSKLADQLGGLNYNKRALDCYGSHYPGKRLSPEGLG